MPYPKYWTTSKLDKLQSLYNSGLSMQEVGDKLNKSVWAIRNAMLRHHITRRSAASTRSVQFTCSPLSFSPKQNLTPAENQLKVAGLMLYWAEGGKRNSKSIDFANSDPDMQKLFLCFLSNIYQVDSARIHIYLYCYPSHDSDKLIDYWSQLLSIPPTQFTKPYIRRDGGKIRDKMKHGLIHIRYSDKRLFEQVMSDISTYKSQVLGW